MIINQFETPNAGVETLIRQGLSRYNQEQVGNHDARRLTLVANDEHGQVIGGVLGESRWGWLLIESLWVAEDFRGRGYGRELLAQAEAVARQWGCTHVALEAFSFQPLPFYQKRGYDVYGQLAGFPAGHTRYSLKKDLNAAAPPAPAHDPHDDALRASEAQLWSLLEHTPAMIVRVDRDCAIQFIRVPGYSAADVQPLIGQDYRQFIQADQDEMVCAAMEAIFDDRQTIQYEVIGLDPQTGLTHWYLTHAAPIIEDDRVIGALLLNTDISEHKQSQKKIQQQNDALAKINWELAIARKQAEATNRMKSQFLASISYELRTPLNAVIGYAQVQLAGITGEMTDEQRGIQERILANAQHLLDLINGVLELSKIESGHMELVSKPFDLRECLAEIDQQHRPLAQDKGLALQVEVDRHFPKVMVGDRERLKQIITNLLSNAIKFTDQGAIQVKATLNMEKAWSIKVSDTGIGIPPNRQMGIFDEFRQVDDDGERGGTGLGLAITRKLVLMMGGTIMVQSEIGRGSSFTVTLPLKASEKSNDLIY